jgi:hypothetical protein
MEADKPLDIPRNIDSLIIIPELFGLKFEELLVVLTG